MSSFLNRRQSCVMLDPGRLSAFRNEADLLGLYLEVGLPSPNPVRRSREVDRPVSAEDHARVLIPQIEAVAASLDAGLPGFTWVIGTIDFGPTRPGPSRSTRR